MINVRLVGKARGFLKNLSELVSDGEIKIKNDNVAFYEVNSKKKLLAKKLLNSSLGDALGIIINIPIKDWKYDENEILLSYNKFLKTKKDYFIIVENPTALYHYSLNRKNTILGKKKLERLINQPNLKGFICISKACYRTLNELTDNKITNQKKVKQIYPVIKGGENKRNVLLEKEIICTYVSSEFYLKGGKEIIEAFKKMEELDVKLRIVTMINKIKGEDLEYIKRNKNIEIKEFKLSSKELNAIYADSDILLHPTKQDSFGLVVLEGMKYGNAIIANQLYSIKELVKDNLNGYLLKAEYEFFYYKNDLPNPAVWNNRKNTIYSDKVDKANSEEIFKKIKCLYENRNLLNQMKQESKKISEIKELNQVYIREQYKKLFREIEGGI